jgi:hypothetical protein
MEVLSYPRALIGALALAILASAPTRAVNAQSGSKRIAEKTGYRISSWRTKGIDQQNQLQLVRAAMTGAPDGMVMFATEMGDTDKCIRAVTALGGEIMARFDEIGYFRARLPLKQFRKAESTPGMLMALIEGGALTYSRSHDMVSYPEPKKSKADSIKADSIAKDSTRKDSIRIAAVPLIPEAAKVPESPYVAMNDMRAYDLRKLDPRFDGRGATVAFLEYGTLDFMHPALQNAKSLDGSTITKLRGVITPYSYDPDFVQPEMLVGGSAYAGFDKNRVRRSKIVTSAGGKFVVDDSTFSAPDGNYSFGWYKNGKKPRGVIWDENRKLVWVDTNGDRSFTEEKAMEEINQKFSIGLLAPLDSTAKEPKRSAYFAVHFDSIPGNVRIYEGTQGHQTMVASVAAGSGILGAADASASGAQIVIVDAGLLAYSFVEAWIRAAKDPRVDVITSSQVGEAFISGGESIVALLMNRMVEVYGKPFFASAHNSGPISTSGGESATVPRVMSVGGYGAAATYKAHYAWDVPEKDYIISYSSRGPSTNGGAKPDILASVLSVAANPCLTTRPAKTVSYRFPECYTLGGGTSSASPHGAGIATLLISAARQSDLPTDARHILWALRMGARYLPNWPAHEQGTGVLDAVRSYELLKIAKEKNLDIPDIETRAPVRTRISKFLREPGSGDGLYEREGWKAGDVGVRTIRLIRRTGSSTPVTYRLDWLGNNGTFTSTQKTVTLPLDVPAEVQVRVAPKTSGIHSAHLMLIDTRGNVPVHRVLNTVVAAERFTAANGYAVKVKETVPWPRAKSYFIDIPDGTTSLRLDLGVTAGRVQLSYSDATLDASYNPRGGKSWRYASNRGKWMYPGKSGTQIIADPEPGVMELLIEPYGDASNGGDSAKYNVPSQFELSASVQRASGRATGSTVVFTNLQGSLGDPRVSTEVGMQRTLRGVAADGEMPTSFFINVDSGATSLRVEAVANNPADELALYLYDCAGPKCALWDLGLRDGPKQTFLVVKPRAGAWKVVVDASKAKGGKAGFKYTEVITSSKFGVSDSSARPSASGRTYTLSAAFNPIGAPKLGYSWVGVADLFDDAVERAERENPIGKFPDHLPPYRPARLATVIVPLSGSATAAETRGDTRAGAKQR